MRPHTPSLIALWIILFAGSTAAALAQGDVFSSSSGRVPPAPAAPGVSAASAALRECRQAVGNAVQAPWIIESAAERCRQIRANAASTPAGAAGATSSCWGLLAAAIAQVRAANEQFQAAKLAIAPQQGQLMDQGNRHLANAMALLDQADQCMARPVDQLATSTGEEDGRSADPDDPAPQGGEPSEDAVDGDGATAGADPGREDGRPQPGPQQGRPEPPANAAELVRAMLDEIDTFWREQFMACRVAYVPPTRKELPERPASVAGRAEPGRPGERGSSNAATSARYNHQTGTLEWSRSGLFADGVLAARAILAHESGHHVQRLQHRLWQNVLDRARARAGLYPVDKELEADFLSGAFLRWLEQRGRLEPRQLAAALARAERGGSSRPAFHYRAHGTPEQRAQAIMAGYLHGLPHELDNDFCTGRWRWQPSP